MGHILFLLRLVIVAAAAVLLSAGCPALPTRPAASPPQTETPVPPTETVVLPAANPGPKSTPAFWPTGMPPPTRGPAVAKLQPENEETCRQKGGYWGSWMCADANAEKRCWEVPTTDAGRPCSDSSECEGWCDPNLTLGQARDLRRGRLMTGTCSRVAGQNWPDMIWLKGGTLQVLMLTCEPHLDGE